MQQNKKKVFNKFIRMENNIFKIGLIDSKEIWLEIQNQMDWTKKTHF